jgi:hypothetical protein
MSESTTSAYAIDRARLPANVRAAVWEVTSQQLHTLALARHRTVLDSGSAVAALQSRITALSKERGVAQAMRVTAPDAVRSSTELLARSQEAMRLGQDAAARELALEGDRVLRQGLQAAAATAARDERLLASNVISGALERIGCVTAVSSAGTKTGIWAERDHQMIAVLLDDAGTAHIDIAGCEGGACTPLHHELETELAAAGVRLREVRHHEHGDSRGGSLIQRAAACRAATMADGLVAAKVSRFAPTATPAPTRVWAS